MFIQISFCINHSDKADGPIYPTEILFSVAFIIFSASYLNPPHNSIQLTPYSYNSFATV